MIYIPLNLVGLSQLDILCHVSLHHMFMFINGIYWYHLAKVNLGYIINLKCNFFFQNDFIACLPIEISEISCIWGWYKEFFSSEALSCRNKLVLQLVNQDQSGLVVLVKLLNKGFLWNIAFLLMLDWYRG